MPKEADLAAQYKVSEQEPRTESRLVFPNQPLRKGYASPIEEILSPGWGSSLIPKKEVAEVSFVLEHFVNF